jgi:hypothetical protein
VALKPGDGIDRDLPHARTTSRRLASSLRTRPYLAKAYL